MSVGLSFWRPDYVECPSDSDPGWQIVSASRRPPRPTTGQRLKDQDETAGGDEKENADDEDDRTKPSKLDESLDEMKEEEEEAE